METHDQRIARLERKIVDLETILRRRETYVEMVDWSAMTNQQRDWAIQRHLEHIQLCLWELSSEIMHVEEHQMHLEGHKWNLY
jgi:hypothetical protein